MVQLRANWIRARKVAVSTFQFQYGSIKRKLIVVIFIVLVRFNSNMVQLRGKLIVVIFIVLVRFNSNMVQLRAIQPS